MKTQNGFTLIELLIVVAIIGILAAIAVPNFLNAMVRAKVAQVQGDFHAFKTALELYYQDNNEYPDCETMEYFDGVQFRAGELFEPVAYAQPQKDPFNQKPTSGRGSFAAFEYLYINWKEKGLFRTLMDHTLEHTPGAPSRVNYFLASQGPNEESEIVNRDESVIYDITNGVVSHGDIVVFSN